MTEKQSTIVYTTVADLIAAGCRVEFNQRWHVDEGSYSSRIKTVEVKFPCETDRPTTLFRMLPTNRLTEDFPLDLELKFTVAPYEDIPNARHRKIAEYLFDIGVQLDITPCNDNEPLLTYVPKGSE